MATVVVGPYSIDDKADAEILAYFAEKTNKSAAFRAAMKQATKNVSTLAGIATSVAEIKERLDRIEGWMQKGLIITQEIQQNDDNADVLKKLDSLFGE